MNRLFVQIYLSLLAVVAGGVAVVVLLAVLAWCVGWLIAKMTPQTPTDGRKQAIFGPPDDG